MSKMHYFRNKVSKIVNRWAPVPPPINLRFWWLAWFGQFVVFQTDYDDIEL